MLHHVNVREEIHHVSEAALVQLRAGKVLGKNSFQPLIFLFNAAHGLIDH